MHGTNAVSKPFYLNKTGALLVNDVWYTIQGEGPDAGRPAVFVRLAKCNLRCYFCDTEFEKGSAISLEDLSLRIIQACQMTHCNLVVITGGEPLLQNICPLVGRLNAQAIYVSVETAGTVCYPALMEFFGPAAIGVIAQGNKIICSPKTPKIAPRLSALVAAWKYIVREGDTADDGLPNVSTQVDAPLLGASRINLYRPHFAQGSPIYVQPMDEGDPEKNQRNAEFAGKIAMAHGYRLSIQLHKIVGVP